MNEKVNNTNIDWHKLLFNKAELLPVLIQNHREGNKIDFSILDDLEDALGLISIQNSSENIQKLEPLIEKITELNENKKGILLSISVLNDEIEKSDLSIFSLDKECNELNDNKNNLNQKISKIKIDRDELLQEINSLNEKIEEGSALQLMHESTKAEYEEKKNNKAKYENRIKDLKAQITRLKKEEIESQEKINKLNSEISAIDDKNNRFNRQKDQLEKQKDDLDIENQKIKSDFEKDSQNINSFRKTNKRLLAEGKKLDQEYDSLSQSSTKIEVQNTQQKKANKLLLDRIDKLKKEASDFEEKEPHLINEKQNLEQEIQEYKKIKEKLDKLLKEKEEFSESSSSIKEQTKKLEDDKKTNTKLRNQIESLQEKIINIKLLIETQEIENNSLLDQKKLIDGETEQLKINIEDNTIDLDLKTQDLKQLETQQLKQQQEVDILSVSAQELKRKERKLKKEIGDQIKENKQFKNKNERLLKEKIAKGNEKVTLEDKYQDLSESINSYEQEKKQLLQIEHDYNTLKAGHNDRVERKESLDEKRKVLELTINGLTDNETTQRELIKKLGNSIKKNDRINGQLMVKNNNLLDQKNNIDESSNKLKQEIDRSIIDIDTANKDFQQLEQEHERSKNELKEVTKKVNSLLQIHENSNSNKKEKEKLVNEITAFLNNTDFSRIDGLIDKIKNYHNKNTDEFSLILNNLIDCKKYADLNKNILKNTKRLNNEIPKLKQNIKGKLDINVEVDRQNLTTMQHSVEEIKQQLDELNSKYNEASINDL